MATVKVAFLPDNSVLLSVTDGAEYPEAQAKIQALVDALNLDGFAVKIDGKIEAHRHDEKKVEVAGRQTAR